MHAVYEYGKSVCRCRYNISSAELCFLFLYHIKKEHNIRGVMHVLDLTTAISCAAYKCLYQKKLNSRFVATESSKGFCYSRWFLYEDCHEVNNG